MLVKWIEGENDGLLTPESVKWANFRGIVRAQNRRGVSHLDEIDFRRRSIEMTIDDHKTDILKFYKDLLYELADMGF